MVGDVKETREKLKREIDKLPDEMVEAINRTIKNRKLGFGHLDASEIFSSLDSSEFLREALRDKITEYE